MWSEVFQTLNLQCPKSMLRSAQWFFVEENGNLLARRVDLSAEWPVLVKTLPAGSAPTVAIAPKA